MWHMSARPPLYFVTKWVHTLRMGAENWRKSIWDPSRVDRRARGSPVCLRNGPQASISVADLGIRGSSRTPTGAPQRLAAAIAQMRWSVVVALAVRGCSWTSSSRLESALIGRELPGRRPGAGKMKRYPVLGNSASGSRTGLPGPVLGRFWPQA